MTINSPSGRIGAAGFWVPGTLSVSLVSCPFSIVSRPSPQPAGYRSGLKLRGEAWCASALLCCSARARSLSSSSRPRCSLSFILPNDTFWLIAPLCRVRVTGLGLGRAVDSPPLTSSIRVCRTSSCFARIPAPLVPSASQVPRRRFWPSVSSSTAATQMSS